jgi:phage shock protein B
MAPAALPVVLMFAVLTLGLLLGVIFACVRMLLRRQAGVQLTRSEAEQLARLEHGLDRMEQRIENMETILLDREKSNSYEVHR